MLHRMFSSLLGLVRVRLELAGLELQEEVDHVVRALVIATAGALLVVAGCVFAAIAVIAALWDTHRILAIASFSAVFLIAGGGLLAYLLSVSRSRGPMFSETAAQFEQDLSRLGERR
jgi:uncharacterized membrane protein YqjE